MENQNEKRLCCPYADKWNSITCLRNKNYYGMTESQTVWWSDVRRHWCWILKTLDDIKVLVGPGWWKVINSFVNAYYSHSTFCRFWNDAVTDTEFRKGSGYMKSFLLHVWSVGHVWLLKNKDKCIGSWIPIAT